MTTQPQTETQIPQNQYQNITLEYATENNKFKSLWKNNQNNLLKPQQPMGYNYMTGVTGVEPLIASSQQTNLDPSLGVYQKLGQQLEQRYQDKEIQKVLIEIERIDQQKMMEKQLRDMERAINAQNDYLAAKK